MPMKEKYFPFNNTLLRTIQVRICSGFIPSLVILYAILIKKSRLFLFPNYQNLTVVFCYDNISLLHKVNIYLIEYFSAKLYSFLLSDKFCVATKMEREYVLGAYSFSEYAFFIFGGWLCILIMRKMLGFVWFQHLLL